MTRKFLTGAMIQSYLNGRQLSELYPSLNNQSKIDYYIKKAQRSKYPLGQNILGIVYKFMKCEKNADAYIQSIHNCVEKDIGEVFNFYYIHGKGLEQYLNSRYLHLIPTEHLENVNKNKQLSNKIQNSMYLIPTLDKIQNCGESGAAAWAKDKLTPWVLSGISSAFTKMDHTIWNKTSNNTNVEESAYANVNQDGQNLSILAGIIRQWESVNVYEQYNVPDSYRDKSELACQIQAEKRAEKRHKCKQSSGIIKKQKSNPHNKENIIEITDDENPCLVGLEQQKKINSLEQEMLNIQKQKNDELKREITLIEKQNRLLGL
ncbi:hypothetical protein GLOIN_2v1763409 [Rhizophagus clarus]|uniref:Uncharacterized protein n=1 Tax=Rhizophagus clarus TaxID=94130 RepID=A0A8H3QSK2_9GLOM|nr:hypothetical protein GLOIN_2v1763409 [Rhizophagus clarus]